MLARPPHGSAEEAVISKLRSERVSRAELFYRNARMLADPVSGFEDADFWSVQALLLTSLYMLAASKRNAAYVYHGKRPLNELCADAKAAIDRGFYTNCITQAWRYDQLLPLDYIGKRACSYSTKPRSAYG